MPEVDLVIEIGVLLLIQSEVFDFEGSRGRNVVQDVGVVEGVFVEEVEVAGPWNL